MKHAIKQLEELAEEYKSRDILKLEFVMNEAHLYDERYVAKACHQYVEYFMKQIEKKEEEREVIHFYS